MEKIQQSKEYNSPQFHLVRQNEQNKVFFTASGGAESVQKTASSTLSSVGGWV